MAETTATGDARLSVYQEVSDGVQTRYSIKFDLGYLSVDDIYIYTGEHADYETQIGYSWLNANEYVLDTPLEDGVEFNVRRVVKRTDMLYKFVTSSLHPQNIDNAYLQLLMLSQELMDGFGDPDGLGNIKNLLDMRGYNITNMADAREGFPQDAVTLDQQNVRFEAVESSIAALDQSVADAQESAFEAGEDAAAAEASAIRAEESANSVRINPTEALSFKDAGDPTPNNLQVDIAKQQEVPAAVGGDYVLVNTEDGLFKVKVSNLIQTGSAYDVRGTLVLDNDANTGTVTDNVNSTTYQIGVGSNPNVDAASGHAYTVTQDAINNGIVGAVADYETGSILMWTGSEWTSVAVAVTSWQGKAGNVSVELGDISTDVIHMYNNTTLTLSEILSDYVIMSALANSSIDIPTVPTASRPDTAEANGRALLHYNPDTRKFEGYYPDDDRYASLGGGGIPATEDAKDAAFVADFDSLYPVAIGASEVHIVTIPSGGLKDAWVGVTDADGTFDVDTGVMLVLSDGETFTYTAESGNKATSLWVNKRNGTTYIRRLANGMWQVADATWGQDSAHLANELAKKGMTEIWTGNVNSGTITCEEGWATYDAIIITGLTGSTRQSYTYPTSMVLNDPTDLWVGLYLFSEGGYYAALTNFTDTEATVVYGETATYYIRGVYGIKY